MLCLSRKADQQILIGSAIRITLLEARGEVVRIGIEAPEGLAIRCPDEPPARPDRPEGRPPRAREPIMAGPGRRTWGQPMVRGLDRAADSPPATDPIDLL
jgi:hypothetical protein